MKNILFFGDSLTAGYGLRNAATESFPALIKQKIAGAGLDYHVINAGSSGDTSAGGLNRLGYWLSNPVDVFVLELGINDIIRHVPPQTILANLQTIIDNVRAKNPNVKMALMGMELPSFVPGALTVPFRDIFRTLATKNQMMLVPFFLQGVAGKSNLNLPDRLHPNAEGYKVIANNVWPIIEKLLVDKAA